MMENNYNEIEFEETNNEYIPEVEADQETDNGSGMSKLIIAGAFAAGAAAIALAKKGWDKWKRHKELRKPDPENPVEVTEEEIAEVATK